MFKQNYKKIILKFVSLLLKTDITTTKMKLKHYQLKKKTY